MNFTDILGLDLNDFLIFLLILVRIGALFSIAPIFGHASVPIQVKIWLSFVMSLLLFPVIDKTAFVVPRETLLLLGLILKEFVVGFAIGYASTFLFSGIQLAGDIIGHQMGFAIANVIDPISNVQVSIIGRLKVILAILIFLLLNGHLWLVYAFASSYKIIPLMGARFSSMFGNKIIEMFCNIFVIAVKVSAPILVALFATSVVLGIIARTIPQINVFIMSFPLRIAVGLFMLATSISFFYYIFQKLFIQLNDDLNILLHSLG